MAKVFALNFATIGEPEYILAKAGLYRVIRMPDGTAIEACEKLTRLFGGSPVPPPEALVPVLIQVATCCNAELGGAIDISGDRSKAGITHAHGAISHLFTLIREAAVATAEERRNLPPVGPL
jgi:hypothetical protein